MPNSEKTIKKPKKVKPAGAAGHRGRMFDKFLAAGDNDVLPRDIIEMLLYYPVKIRDTRDAAVLLMDKFGSADKILSASSEKLASVDGVGEGSAAFLNIIGCITKRLSDEPDDNRKIYTDTAEITELFQPFREGIRADITCVACFDNAMRPIRVAKLKNGAFTECPEDANALVSFVSDHHGCSVAIARISPKRSDFPGFDDISAARYARLLLKRIDVNLKEYFVISRDEAIEVPQSAM